MFYQRMRQLFKRTLSLARIKLLYTRITLTRFTAVYFLLSFFACVGLVSLQGLTLADNTAAVRLLGTVFQNSQNMTGLPIVTQGVLRMCSDIPDRTNNCTAMASFGGITPLTEGGPSRMSKRTLVPSDYLVLPRHGKQDEGVDIKMNLSLGLTDGCIASLKWLDDVLHDAQREDAVTLFFQIWLFVLSVITIVSESIPHLGAGFGGHVLGTAWAGYRLRSTITTKNLYRETIVPNVCGGIDLVGNWWEIRISHAIPIVVINVITLLGVGYTSYRLFQVYANQSFCRVGASERVYRIYKIVLLFSVCMQLSGFFSIASTAMWIDKVCHGLLHSLAKHANIYLAAFITNLVLHVPWLYFGWICVRRECRIRFGVFCGISVFLTTISTLIFASHLYRYIFSTWPFFATVTVTAYCLVIASTILGVICQFNFGQGLAHYLLVTEALEGVDFTPVSFPKGNSKDIEKNEKESSSFDLPSFPITAWQPKKPRGSSVYSEMNGTPIILSSSPPLVSELGPAPSRSFFTKPSNRNSVYNQKVRDTVSTFASRNTIKEDEPMVEVVDLPRKALLPVNPIDTNVKGRLITSSPLFDSPASTQGSNPIRVSIPANPRMGSPTRRSPTGAPGLPSSPRLRQLGGKF